MAVLESCYPSIRVKYILSLSLKKKKKMDWRWGVVYTFPVCVFWCDYFSIFVFRWGHSTCSFLRLHVAAQSSYLIFCFCVCFSVAWSLLCFTFIVSVWLGNWEVFCVCMFGFWCDPADWKVFCVCMFWYNLVGWYIFVFWDDQVSWEVFCVCVFQQELFDLLVFIVCVSKELPGWLISLPCVCFSMTKSYW